MPKIAQQDRKTELEAWHASLKAVFLGHGPQTGTQVRLSPANPRHLRSTPQGLPHL